MTLKHSIDILNKNEILRINVNSTVVHFKPLVLLGIVMQQFEIQVKNVTMRLASTAHASNY